MKGLLGDTRVDIVHPGSEVPSCFHHQKAESVISFLEPADSYPNIAGLAFCAVIRGREGSQGRANVSCEIQFFVNKERTYGFMEQFPLLEFDHQWLHYVPRHKMWGFDTKLQEKSSRFVVLFQASLDAGKCWGVHVVHSKNKFQKVKSALEHLSLDEGDAGGRSDKKRTRGQSGREDVSRGKTVKT